MAWNNAGNIRGPQGPKGATGPQGPAGAAAPKYYGILRWGNFGWYDPPGNQFHRLLSTSGARLYAWKSVGGVALVNNNTPRLVAPVSGIYLLTAIQTWGNSTAAKGMGLGRSLTNGADGMELWGDFNSVSHAQLSAARYLSAGDTLYPWTWNGQGTGMSFSDRGLYSEYSMVLLHQE